MRNFSQHNMGRRLDAESASLAVLYFREKVGKRVNLGSKCCSRGSYRSVPSLSISTLVPSCQVARGVALGQRALRQRGRRARRARRGREGFNVPAFGSLLVISGTFPVSFRIRFGKIESSNALEHGHVALQHSLERPHTRPVHPLSNTNGILNRSLSRTRGAAARDAEN